LVNLNLNEYKINEHCLNTAFEVKSASIGLHRRHTVASPSLYRHSPVSTVPNRSSTGKSLGYVSSPPGHIVAKPGDTVYPPWTQFLPVLLRLHVVVLRWIDRLAWRVAAMPRNRPALFRTRCLFPMIDRRFNTVHPKLQLCLRRRYGVVLVGHAVVKSGLKTGTVWTRLYWLSTLSLSWFLFIFTNFEQTYVF